MAFYSYASNLVAGDSNGSYDVFVHDRSAANQPPMAVAAAAPNPADSIVAWAWVGDVTVHRNY